MVRYRVECNFGCRYFNDPDKANKYFEKCKSRHLDCEIWLVAYACKKWHKREMAVQILLDYSGTCLPKY